MNSESTIAIESLRISTHTLGGEFGGLSVTIGHTTASALVHAFFVVATEARDDRGLPHTLEHLIFHGSEQYGCKGLLDACANRSLGNGTNAWTAVDSTVYTLTTAGAEGCLNVLPVFLDHVLFPTLNDTSFLAEVHHVDGDGHDAGVVYAEMQGRENDAQSLAFNALQRAVYGDPSACGLAAETGGKLRELRALTNAEVRAYHREFYTPHNLNVVVVGAVTLDDVLRALAPMRAKLAQRSAEVGAPARPWQAPVPPFVPAAPADNCSLIKIEFPDDADEDDAVGHALLGQRGPLYGDFDRHAALEALLVYLTDSSVSPLSAALVDCDDALCSAVDYGFEDGPEAMLYVQLEDVPVERLPTSRDEFRAALAAVTSVDLARMRDLLRRKRFELLEEIEQTPENFVIGLVVPHFLYGSGAAQLRQAAAHFERLDALALKDEQFWLALLRRELLERAYVWVEARPSEELSDAMQDDEEERIDAQCEALGDAGLAAKARELRDAMETLDQPIPDALLTAIPVPSVGGVRRVAAAIACNADGLAVTGSGAAVAALQHYLESGADVRSRLQALPVAVQVGHAATAFCVVEAFVDTTPLSWVQRRALEVLLEAQFELAMRAAGDAPALTHEQVVEGLSRDLLTHSNSLGFSASTFSVGSFGALMRIELKAAADKYDAAVAWLAAALYRGVWSQERIAIAASKLEKSIGNAQRSGSLVARSALFRRLFAGNELSNHSACWLGEQRVYLEQLLSAVADESAASGAVVRDFAALQQTLADAVVLVNVACDVTRVRDVVSPLERLFALAPPSARRSGGRLASVPTSRALLPSDWSAVRGTTIVSLASIESSFMLQATPVSLAFDSDDVPALWVACQLLDAMEGPFWKGIRGAGFSYGFGIDFNCESGLIVFSLTKATSLVKGMRAAKAIVDEFASGARQFDQLSIDGARSTVTFRLLESEATPLGAVATAFVERLQGHVGLQERQLHAVSQVTAESLRAVLARYVVPLFDDANNTRLIRIISTNSAKSEEIAEELRKDCPGVVEIKTVDDL
jgi:Zn-dependent M16 (insulinase) family peptidase